jgi:hypothetical protein
MNMNNCSNFKTKSLQKKTYILVCAKKTNRSDVKINLNVPNNTTFCFFLHRPLHMSFLGNFWCAVRTPVHVHFPKKSSLFILSAIFYLTRSIYTRVQNWLFVLMRPILFSLLKHSFWPPTQKTMVYVLLKDADFVVF